MMTKKKKQEPFAVLPLLSYHVECYWADLTDTDRDADYSHPLRRIRICESLKGNPADVRERLLHECLHAVESHMHLDISHEHVKLLGAGLAQLLAQYIKPVR